VDSWRRSFAAGGAPTGAGLAPVVAADLHGDGGRVSNVRVEISRLRKLLGRASTPTATTRRS
jgi:hypothetical protein